MRSIIVDFEYTTWPGALESGWSLPDQHREIVQMGCITFDDDGHDVAGSEFLVKPVINPVLSPLFIELTGIQQDDVDGYGHTFFYVWNVLYAATRSWERPIICMNGDEGVFRENCDIHGLPYPTRSWHRLRPFLEAQGIDLSSMSSGDLHKLTGAPLEGHTHNAAHDVLSMAHWLSDARQRGIFASVDQLPTGIPDRDPRSLPLETL